MTKPCRVRCFADLHLHEWREGATINDRGLNSRLLRQVEAIRALCADPGRPEWAAVCGDLAHSRAGLTAHVLWALRQVLEALNEGFRQTWIIPGNHDYPAKRGPAPFHALCWAEAAKNLPNVRIVSEPGRWSVPGSPAVFCLPWIGDFDTLKAAAAELAADAQARQTGAPRLLIAHVGLDGAALNDSFFASGRPVKLDDLRPDAYDFVALGDYHLRQRVGPNAWYIGSPMQHTRGEAGQPKGAVDVDLADPLAEPVFVPSGASEFCAFRLEGDAKAAKAVQKEAAAAAREGHFVRLVAPPELGHAQLKAAEKTGLPIEREPAPPAGPRVELPLSASVPEIVAAYADSLRGTAAGDCFADEVMAGLATIQPTLQTREDRREPWFRPLALRAENFLGYERLHIANLEGLGAVFLDGANLDSPVQRSNGAGKSTVADAICFALFGRTLRDGVKVAEAQRVGRERGSDSFAEVVVLLRDGRRRARIRRGVGKGGLALAVDSPPEGFRDVTPADRQQQAAMIQDWLGMDFELFRRLVVFGQSGGEAFASLADSGRKATLEALVSGDRFEPWLAEAKAARAAASDSLAAAESRLRVAEARAEERREVLKRTREHAATWEDAQADALRKFDDERACLLDRREVRERELAAFADLPAKLAEREKAAEEAARAAASAKAAVLELLEVERLLAAELAPLEHEARRLRFRRRLVASQDPGVCEACGQHFTAASQARALAEIDAAIAEIEAESATPAADQARIREELRRQPLREKHQAQRQEFESCGSAAYEQVERSRAAVETIREQLRGEPLARERLEQAERELAALDARREAAEAEQNPGAGLVAKAETAAQEAAQEAEDAKAQAEAAGAAALRFRALCDALGNQGARVFLLEQLAPRIQEKANEALAAMSGGALSVALRVESAAGGQKTVLEVANSIGAPCYGGDSGGERRLVDLALAWAIHEAGSAGLSFRIVDEAFDALDPDAAARAGAFLASSVRTGETLVVVSHNASVAERFAGRRWLAVKEGRVCRLEWAE